MFMSKYMQYYAFDLHFRESINLLRLGKLYFTHEVNDQFQEIFNKHEYPYVSLVHNPWFSVIYVGESKEVKPWKLQILQDLYDFRSCPYHTFYLPERNITECYFC